MKLNYKRTIFVGFAFFLICTFWQAYDTIIPKILTDKFGMNQAHSGIVMALDNILALFMLPLFGAISDRCKNRNGRRTPFIMIGTIAAAILLIALSFVDNMQLKNIEKVSAIDNQEALTVLYNAEKDETLHTPEGEEFILADMFTEEEFTAITSQVENPETGKKENNRNYTNYVVPARQHYAQQMTAVHPGPRESGYQPYSGGPPQARPGAGLHTGRKPGAPAVLGTRLPACRFHQKRRSAPLCGKAD